MYDRTHLYPAVTPVCNNDVSISVHCYTCGSIELAIPLTMGTKLKEKLPISIVYLRTRQKKT